jgi:hypothetical protein
VDLRLRSGVAINSFVTFVVSGAGSSGELRRIQLILPRERKEILVYQDVIDPGIHADDSNHSFPHAGPSLSHHLADPRSGGGVHA